MQYLHDTIRCMHVLQHLQPYKALSFLGQPKEIQRLHPQRMPLMLLAGGIRCELSRVGRVGGSGFRSKLPGG